MERQAVIDLTDESDAPPRSSRSSRNHFVPDAAPIGVDICPDIIDLDRDIYSGESEIRHYQFDSHDLDLMQKRAAHGKAAVKTRSKTANKAATTLTSSATSKAIAEETSSKLTGKSISKGTGKAMSIPKEKVNGKRFRKAMSKATSEVSSKKEAKSKAATKATRNATNKQGGRRTAQRINEHENQTLRQIYKAARSSKEEDALLSIVPDNLRPHPFISTREDTEQEKMGEKKDATNFKRTRDDGESKTPGKTMRKMRRTTNAVVLLGESSLLDDRFTDEQHTSYGVESMLASSLDASAHTSKHVHPKQKSCGPDVASTYDAFPPADMDSYDKDQQNRRLVAHHVRDRNRRVNNGDSDQRPFDMKTNQPPAGRGCFDPPIKQWLGHHRPHHVGDRNKRVNCGDSDQRSFDMKTKQPPAGRGCFGQPIEQWRGNHRPHHVGDRSKRANFRDSDPRPFNMKAKQPPAGRGCFGAAGRGDFGPPTEQWRGHHRPNNRGRPQTIRGRHHPFHRAPGHPMGCGSNFVQFSGQFRPPPLSSSYGVSTKLETSPITTPSLDRDGLSDESQKFDCKNSEIRLASPDQTDQPQKSASPMYQSDDLVLDRRDHRILSLEEEMEQAAWSNGLYAGQRAVGEEMSGSEATTDNGVSMIAVEERGEVEVAGDCPPVARDSQMSLKSEISGVSIEVYRVTNDIASVARRKDDTAGKVVSVAEGMRAEIRCKETQGSMLLTPEGDNTSVYKSRAGAVPEPTVFADVSPSALKPSLRDGDGKAVDSLEHNAASSPERAFVVMAESSDEREEEEEMLVHLLKPKRFRKAKPILSSFAKKGTADSKMREIRLASPNQTDQPQKSASLMYQSDDLVLDRRDHRILSLEEEMEQAAWSNGLYAGQRAVDEEISESKTTFDNGVSMIAVEERGEVDVAGDRPPVARDSQMSLKSEISGVSIEVNRVTNDIASVARRMDDTAGKVVSVAEGMRAEIRCKENQGSMLLTPEDDNTSVYKSRAGAVPEPTVFADVSPSALKPSLRDGDGKEVDSLEHNAASSPERAFVVMAESSDEREEEEEMLVHLLKPKRFRKAKPILSSFAKKGTAASQAIFAPQCSSWLNSFFSFWNTDIFRGGGGDIFIGSNNPECVTVAPKTDADYGGVQIDNTIIAASCDTIVLDGGSIDCQEEAIADASPSVWKPSLNDSEVIESGGHEHNPASSSETAFVTMVESREESVEEEEVHLMKPMRFRAIKRGTRKRLLSSKNKSGKEGAADEIQPPDQTGKNKTAHEVEVVTKTTCETDVTNAQSSEVREEHLASSNPAGIASAPKNDSTINGVQMNDILVVDDIISSCDKIVKDADSIGSRQAASAANSVLKLSMPDVDGKEVEPTAASSSETAFVIIVESSDESEGEEVDMLIHLVKPKRFKPIRRRKEKRLISSKSKFCTKGTPRETKPPDQNETNESSPPFPSLVFGVARGNKPSSVSSSIPSSTCDKPKRAHSAFTAAVRQKYRRTVVTEEHSYNFSHEDALKEQERLFRGSAARMRQQTQFRVESQNSIPNPTMFDAPVHDVAKRFPYHWQSHDMHARLGLHEGASFQLIKSHYRRLALAYHPDKSNDESSAVKFQAITEAYRTLGGRYHL